MAVTVADIFVRYRADTADAERGIENVNRRLLESQSLGQRFGSALVTAGRVAATATVALGAALVGVGVSGTRAAMDLEQQMANIAAIMGSTRSEVEPLRDLIVSLGLDPNLQVDAAGAAAAIEMLARNGMSMAQILDGAARATIALANATGGDLSVAADTATDVLGQFGEQAGSFEDVVNAITGVVNNSKFTLDDFQLALAQAGGVAAATGVPFNEFATVIAGISPLFASGSDAGTSFKTFLQRLVPQSKEAAKAMAELGLITEDGSNAFFDANGNLKSMAEISAILQNALSGLTEEQRNAYLATIFGTDAMRAAVGVAQLGADGFNELATAIEGTSALDAAATRMDTARGALEILGGVLDTVKISIGEAFLPIVKELATALANLVSENQDKITAFFQGMADKIQQLIDFGSNLATAISTWGLEELFAVFEDGSSHLGALLEIFGMSEEKAYALAAAILGLVNQARAIIAPVVEVVGQFVSWKDVLAALGILIGAAVIPALAAIAAKAAVVAAAFSALVAGVAAVRNAWESDFAGIRTKTLEATSAISSALSDMNSWLSENVPAAVSALNSKFEEYWPSVRDAVLSAWNEIQVTLELFAELLSVVLPLAAQALSEKFNEVWPQVAAAVSAAWSVIAGVFSAMKDWLDSTLRLALSGFKTWIAGFTLPNPFEALSSTINAIQSAIDSLKSKISEFKDWIGSISIPNPFAGINLPSLGLPGLGGRATGGVAVPGGWTLVGERGPELVRLPAGAAVYTAKDTERMLAGSVTVNVYANVADSVDAELWAQRIAEIIRRRGV